MEYSELEEGEFCAYMDDAMVDVDIALSYILEIHGVSNSVQSILVEEMEHLDLEEGEACACMDNARVDVDIALSYIDEKLQNFLGHFRKDFEGEISAEKLGPKFGGYGSFLPAYRRPPSTVSKRATPQIVEIRTEQRSSITCPAQTMTPQIVEIRTTEISPLTCSAKYFPQNSVALLNAPFPVKHRTATRSMNPLRDRGDVSSNQDLRPAFDEAAEKNSEKRRPSLSKPANPTDRIKLKVKIKLRPGNTAQKNSAIYSGLGLTSPSSSVDTGSSRFKCEATPDKSVGAILQTMTSFPVADDRLLSPLHDRLLCLKPKDKVSVDSVLKKKKTANSLGRKSEKPNTVMGSSCMDLKSKPLSNIALNNGDSSNRAGGLPKASREAEKEAPLEKKVTNKDMMKGKSLSTDLVSKPDSSAKKLSIEGKMKPKGSVNGGKVDSKRVDGSLSAGFSAAPKEKKSAPRSPQKDRKFYEELFNTRNPPNAVSLAKALPSEVETASASLIEDWVCCDRCQKWRLLPYGMKPEQLPEKWLCSMLDWLPEMNQCGISEQATTDALRAMYILEVPENQNNLQNRVDGTASADASHLSQHHQNGGYSAPCKSGKNNPGLNDIPCASTSGGLVQSVKNKSLDGTNKLAPEKNPIHKSKARRTSIGGRRIDISNEKPPIGGDTKQKKLTGKRDANHHGHESVKKSKIEDASHHGHGGSEHAVKAGRVGCNSTTHFQTQSALKGVEKPNNNRYHKDAKGEAKESLSIHAKTQRDRARGSTFDEREMSMKKRKLKDRQDGQNHVKDGGYRKEKKSRVVSMAETSASTMVSGSCETRVKGLPVGSVSSSPVRNSDFKGKPLPEHHDLPVTKSPRKETKTDAHHVRPQHQKREQQSKFRENDSSCMNSDAPSNSIIQKNRDFEGEVAGRSDSSRQVESTVVKSQLHRNQVERASSNQVASLLKEAEDLRACADRLKSSEFHSECYQAYFQAALKFFLGASLLENCNGDNGKHGEITRTRMYLKAAQLCEIVAVECEKTREMAAAALAYKCMEVAYMRIVFCKNSSASDLHARLQTLPRDESPSSSASDIDNLNSQASAEKAAGSKDMASQAGSHFKTPPNRQNVVQLLDFARDVSTAMEASRKSQIAFAAAKVILEEAKNKEGIVSVKKVIDFSFHDVAELVKLVRLSIEAIVCKALHVPKA